MIFTQLRSFHAVATENGFTAASKVLHVGQPTLTSQVRALEDMNPRDGLSEMLISVNATPASQLGQSPSPEDSTS